MTKHRELHSKGTTHLRELEAIIDDLKDLGPCRLDRDNAILNLKDQLRHVLYRCDA